MSAERICYVHVGTHKTGTTSIQAFLRNNRELFAAHGLLIPRSGRSENDAGHHNLTQELMAAPDFVPERGGLAELSAELASTSQRLACISCEDFSLLSRDRVALERLRDGIAGAGFTPVILAYLRPQVSYLVSIYAEIVKNGNYKPFPTYVRELREHGSFLWHGIAGPPFRYDRMLDDFAAVFGRPAIVARRYRSAAPDRALLMSFAATLLGPAAHALTFSYPRIRTNPSLTFGGVLRTFGYDVGTEDMRFAPLGLREAIAVAWSFLPANLDLWRRYGVRIPPCEVRDLVLALPWRKNYRWTRAINSGRRILAGVGETPLEAADPGPGQLEKARSNAADAMT